MKRFIDPVVKTASDLTRISKRVVEDGVEFFRGTLGEIPLLSSVVVRQAEDECGRDQTHYFLVPNRLEITGYSLYVQRVLPCGIGPENDLPKARIFHLPAQGTQDALMILLTNNLEKNHRERIKDDSPLADRLDLVADEIDKQSNKVTGGLVLIGGIVAIANPLLGVGIAAKALLPAVGSKLSKHGLNHVTDWLRENKRQSSDQEASKKAAKEIKKLKPEVIVDPVLALLEQSLATSDPDFDPSLRFAEMLNTPAETTATVLTCTAIDAVYQEILDQPERYSDACLHKAEVTWLTAVSDLAKTPSEG